MSDIGETGHTYRTGFDRCMRGKEKLLRELSISRYIVEWRSEIRMEVVGVATHGEEAIALAASLQPDVILMDIKMPGVNGIDATRHIVRTSPHIRILVVTMFEEEHSVFTALRAGALGHVLKDADEEEILRSIRAVGNGQAIFSPSIAERLLNFFAASRPLMQYSQVFPELTEREREILHLIAQGHSNSDIARQLVLSLKTVANHVSNIFSKL